MIGDLSIPSFLIVGAVALGGVVVGFGYFAALRWTAALAAGRGWLAPAALTVGRIALAILFFRLAVRFGAIALLAGFAGFLVARWVAMRAVRRAG